MVGCRYCHEGDESELIMSSRCINGEVKTIDICLRCFWREEFEAKNRGDRRMSGRLSERKAIEVSESDRDSGVSIL